MIQNEEWVGVDNEVVHYYDSMKECMMGGHKLNMTKRYYIHHYKEEHNILG